MKNWHLSIILNYWKRIATIKPFLGHSMPFIAMDNSRPSFRPSCESSLQSEARGTLPPELGKWSWRSSSHSRCRRSWCNRLYQPSTYVSMCCTTKTHIYIYMMYNQGTYWDTFTKIVLMTMVIMLMIMSMRVPSENSAAKHPPLSLALCAEYPSAYVQPPPLPLPDSPLSLTMSLSHQLHGKT